MSVGYSIKDVAAFEEVDDTPMTILSVEEKNKLAVQTIIKLAQMEHEEQFEDQVISEIKKRKEQESARLCDINKFHSSFIREDQTKYGFKDLMEDLNVSSSDESDDDDYDDYY
ncbi:hypothetical protein KR074_010456, partial [Drosophila pseudoananassae]